MSGDFIYHLHEVLGIKRYIPTEETVLIPMEYVDVMGQTRATRDTGSEHTFNDYCYDESDVSRNGSEHKEFKY